MISPLNFHANTLTSKYGLTLMLSLLSSHLSIFMQILSPPGMVSPVNFHANTLTSKHDLTSQFSCKYSHLPAWSDLSSFMQILSPPAWSTSQLSCQMLSPPSMTLPLNFYANTLNSKYGLTLMLSLLSSHLSIFMQILSPPSMVSPLCFHCSALTSQFSCKYSHLQVWSHPYALTA